MIADIIFNSRSKGKEYCGEGEYVLVLRENDQCIGGHFCSNRNWAIHDFGTMHLDEIEKHNVTEIYSLGKLVWFKK